MAEEVMLPAFEMDCRDWLVSTPAEDGLPDEVGGAPLLAVLSTAVFDAEDFHSASAVLTVGLLDDDAPATGGYGAELLDGDEDSIRYLVPSPDRSLALLAEFTVPRLGDGEVIRRIEALMTSFRWAA